MSEILTREEFEGWLAVAVKHRADKSTDLPVKNLLAHDAALREEVEKRDASIRFWQFGCDTEKARADAAEAEVERLASRIDDSYYAEVERLMKIIEDAPCPHGSVAHEDKSAYPDCWKVAAQARPARVPHAAGEKR